jgi:poly(A) polymerase
LGSVKARTRAVHYTSASLLEGKPNDHYNRGTKKFLQALDDLNLLIRYGTNADGKPVKKAHIYTAEDHCIDPGSIDTDAKAIIRRLRRAGFEAYIVGGAVRDLLTGRKPKDFDIATDAFPRRIRKIFPNSRIIGRRFRLVHIYAQPGRGRIFEVSTFRAAQGSERSEKRSRENPKGSGIYGSIEEDVWRRDFTLNALYYCPLRRIIIDFVGGYRDIQEKKICTLAPADSSFCEDPVRMIRGIKYAEITGFPLTGAITGSIKRHRHKLTTCSAARLTEEFYKILASGFAAGIFLRIYRLKLLEVFFPGLHDAWQPLSRRQLIDNLNSGLDSLDQRVRKDSLSRGSMLGYLMRSFGRQWDRNVEQERVMEWIQETCRPLLPSRKETQRAAALLVRWIIA